MHSGQSCVKLYKCWGESIENLRRNGGLLVTIMLLGMDRRSFLPSHYPRVVNTAYNDMGMPVNYLLERGLWAT